MRQVRIVLKIYGWLEVPDDATSEAIEAASETITIRARDAVETGDPYLERVIIVEGTDVPEDEL